MGTNHPHLTELWGELNQMVCAKFLPYKVLTSILNWITLLSTVVATLSKCQVQHSTLAIEIPASVQFATKRAAPKMLQVKNSRCTNAAQDAKL